MDEVASELGITRSALYHYVSGKEALLATIHQTLEQGMAEGLSRHANPRLQTAAILGMCNWTYKWYKSEGNMSMSYSVKKAGGKAFL